MGNIALGARNILNEATVTWYGDEDVGYPKTNLAGPVLSKPWRYTPAADPNGTYARIAFSAAQFQTNHIALVKHNLGQNAQIRVKVGTARLDLDFTKDNEITDMVTFAGGTNGSCVDEYGRLTFHSAPRYHHDRRFPRNGFVNSDTLLSFTTYLAGYKYEDNETVNMPVGSVIRSTSIWSHVDTYEISCQAKLVSGEGSLRGHHAASGISPTLNVTSDVVVVTPEWQWIRCMVNISAKAAAIAASGFEKINGDGVIKFRKMQIHRGPSNGQYFRTGSLRRYQRVGVITEAGVPNYMLYSTDFSNAAWTKTLTVTSNNIAGPEGTGNTCDTLTCTVAGQDIYQDHSTVGVQGRGASLIFKRSGSCRDAELIIEWTNGTGGLQSISCRFDPFLGDYLGSTTTNGGFISNPSMVGVKDEGEAWFRAYIYGQNTVDSTNTNMRYRIRCNSTGTIFAYGAQLEPSGTSTFVAPTGATTLTRTVDTAVVDPTFWVPYIWNRDEGTLYHEAVADDILGANSGTTNLSFVAFRDSGNTNITESRIATAVVGGITPSMGATPRITTNSVVIYAPANTYTAPQTTPIKTALKWRVGDIWEHAVAGLVRTTDPDAPPIGCTIFELMRTPSVGTGYLRRVTVWPVALTTAQLNAVTSTGPSAVDYDSGWDPVVQMSRRGDLPANWGNDYDIIKTFPLRNVEWVHIDLYDPDKTSGTVPFSIGMLFSGTNVVQPETNGEYGLENKWHDWTTFGRARDGRKFFDQGNRDRQSAFSFEKLTHSEGHAFHEMQGNQGISGDIIFLPDPDDEGECQRYGFVGNLMDLDPIAYPAYATRSAAFQVEKRR